MTAANNTMNAYAKMWEESTRLKELLDGPAKTYRISRILDDRVSATVVVLHLLTSLATAAP